MKLDLSSLSDPRFAERGIAIPAFDIAQMRARTKAAPAWVHFGAGNLFRAFPAADLQKLLNEGVYDKGVIIAESYDPQILQMTYHDHDDLTLAVVLKADGNMEKTVIGSIAEGLFVSPAHEDFQRMKAIFSSPTLQMASFTITEKGYSTAAPAMQQDQSAGPDAPGSLMGALIALLIARFNANAAPIALVSMDNCSQNGKKLREAVLFLADAWEAAGKLPEGFHAWLADEEKVAFPWSMIDKITPRPDEKVRKSLEEDGFTDMQVRVTDKGSYTAPFVNAEAPEYLVIEDRFPNGRPPLEKCGMLFTDRETVNRVERMKVTTCLNPAHTALAVFGCLLGFDYIYEEVSDPALSALARRVAYTEGLPVVTDPGILSPRAFINEVFDVRLPNPFMPDTPQRIATDTSQKLGIRFGETLKSYLADPALSVDSLVAIPLVQAGWIRYLMGVDDSGNAFTCSSDPLMERLAPIAAQLKLGETDFDEELLRPILSDASIYGVDLYEAGVADKVIANLRSMLKGPGAVRAALEEQLF